MNTFNMQSNKRSNQIKGVNDDFWKFCAGIVTKPDSKFRILSVSTHIINYKIEVSGFYNIYIYFNIYHIL